MSDKSLDQTTAFLKAKLPEYLRQKGINPSAAFTCVNPDDRERLPSMSYDPASQTVRCFNCGARYTVFDLVGCDYNLKDYTSQFIKTHQLFIGSVPIEFINELNPIVNSTSQPHFEIAGDFKPEAAGPGLPPASYAGARARPTNDALPFPYGAPDGRFIKTSRGGPFIDSNQIGAGVSEEPLFNYSEYLDETVRNREQTDYFRKRGLSDEVIRRFRLGFDNNCLVSIDPDGNKIFWQAAIIPFGNRGYRIRNIDPKDPDRFRTKGICGIYNSQALEAPGKIFITEGEFDALTLESLGCKALALAGSGSAGRLVDLIKSSPVEHCFYICMDNDQSGRGNSRLIASALYQMQIAYKEVNLSFPYKDINEAYCAEREAFTDKLDNLDRLLELDLSLPEFSAQPESFITTPEDLSTLDLSPALYSFCGRPSVLRLLLAYIVNSRASTILYAASLAQCQNLKPHLDPAVTGADGNSGRQTLKFVRIADRRIGEILREGLSACVLQGNLPRVIVVDSSILDEDSVLNLAGELAVLPQSLKCPIIQLCGEKLSPRVESVSLQNVDFTLTDDGDFRCSTITFDGHPVSFVKYAGI